MAAEVKERPMQSVLKQPIIPITPIPQIQPKADKINNGRNRQCAISSVLDWLMNCYSENLLSVQILLYSDGETPTTALNFFEKYT